MCVSPSNSNITKILISSFDLTTNIYVYIESLVGPGIGTCRAGVGSVLDVK